MSEIKISGMKGKWHVKKKKQQQTQSQKYMTRYGLLQICKIKVLAKNKLNKNKFKSALNAENIEQKINCQLLKAVKQQIEANNLNVFCLPNAMKKDVRFENISLLETFVENYYLNAR